MGQRTYRAISVILGLSGMLLLLGHQAVDLQHGIVANQMDPAERIRMVGALLLGLGLLGISRGGFGPAEAEGRHVGRFTGRAMARGHHG